MGVRVAERSAASYDYPLLIRHLLHTPLAIAADQEIVHRDRGRYSYAQIVERVARLARALTKLGANEGSVVSVMDWDSNRYFECYFAVPMLGAVLHTVNIRLSPEQILYTLNHARADVLLVHRDFLPVLQQIRSQLTTVRRFVLVEDAESGALPDAGFAGEYEALLAAESSEFAFKDFDENALATTFYTSGTTGLPKAVSFSHRQIVLHTLAALGAVASAGAGQSFNQTDVYMPISPMFHVHAWGFPYVATVLGVKQVYPGRYDPETLLALKQAEGVTFSHCVPTILQMLLDAPSSARMDLRGWKVAIGGAALSTALARRALQRGIDVFAGYGMSETCSTVGLTRFRAGHAPQDEAEELALRCRARVSMPLVEVRLIDESFADVPRDGVTPGEVVVRAPWLTKAYAGDPDASMKLWEGGYLHTQDIATIDAHGYLQVRDRIKDVIKTGGEWISSIALEEMICGHAAVVEAAVVGVPDERWGERPLALVVARGSQDAAGLQIDLRAHLTRFVATGAIPKYAVPDRIEIVASLPRTSVGKVDKKLIRRQLAESAAR